MKLTKKKGEPAPEPNGHIENFIYDLSLPAYVRAWIIVQRLPAIEKWAVESTFGVGKLFADSPEFPGIRVRVTMASRLGDVGITPDLNREMGYDKRVMFETLDNFSWGHPDPDATDDEKLPAMLRRQAE